MRQCLAPKRAAQHWEQSRDLPRAWELYFTSRAASRSCRLLGTTGVFPSPFLCLHAVSGDLRLETAQGLRLKIQETTKLRMGLATRFLGRSYMHVFYTGIVTRQLKNLASSLSASSSHPLYTRLGAEEAGPTPPHTAPLLPHPTSWDEALSAG